MPLDEPTDRTPPTTAGAAGRPFIERLSPGLGAYAAAFGLGVFVVLALLPLGATFALVTAVVVALGAAALLWSRSPIVSVSDGRLSAGRASIPCSVLGAAVPIAREAMRDELGTRLDARAHVVHRSWARTAVRVMLEDPADPTPYWLVSTRNPTALVAAIDAAR